jgi:hypothetical protein
MKAQSGRKSYSSTFSLASVLKVGGWVVSDIPQPLYTQETDLVPTAQEAVRALGPVLMVQKILLPLGFKHQTVQPVTICYTDYTIPDAFEHDRQ